MPCITRWSYLSSAGGGVGGTGSPFGGSGSFGKSGSFIFRVRSNCFLVFLFIHPRRLVGGGVFGAVGKGTGSGLGGGCRGLGSRLLFSSLSMPLVGILPRVMVELFWKIKNKNMKKMKNWNSEELDMSKVHKSPCPLAPPLAWSKCK